MTTQTIHIVWHDEQIRSAFTTREAADAFVATHFPNSKDVWILSQNVHDVAPEDVTPPQRGYVVACAPRKELSILAEAFGQPFGPAEEERAVAVNISKFDSRSGFYPVEEFEALDENQALVYGRRGPDCFSVIAKTREAAEDLYLEELFESTRTN